MSEGSHALQYVPGDDAEEARLIESLGPDGWKRIVSQIPDDCRFDGTMGLGPGLSELEVAEAQRERASRNRSSHQVVSFVGAGAYDHWIPAAVDRLVMRSELMTCYTPYQAEVSQGTLQAMFEYQTCICALTGMDNANASLYDGASAVAEAVLMFVRGNGTGRVLMSGGINPRYVRVLKTYLGGLDVTLDALPPAEALPLDELRTRAPGCACAVVQNPGFFGTLEPMRDVAQILAEADVPLIAVVNPVSLGMLVSPGEYGAAVAVGEGQSLGNHLSFGGPYLGFMACRASLLRRMPGRLAGMTYDEAGRRGFVLTLQTREQHIRRSRATSNICTNQGLNAVAACIYLSLLGPDGLRSVATSCFEKAHYAAGLAEDAGLELPFGAPFFMEFVVRLPGPADVLISALAHQGVLPGYSLGRFYPQMQDCLLVAVTEKRTREQIEHWIDLVRNFQW